MNELIERDLKNISNKKFFLPNSEKKLYNSFFYEIFNSSYTRLIVKELDCITNKNNPLIKYSLNNVNEKGDILLKTTMNIIIENITISNYLVNFKKNIIKKIINYIKFKFDNKEFKITPVILRVWYNYFDKNINKNKYNLLFGKLIKLPKYSLDSLILNINLPFFYSFDSMYSFPDFRFKDSCIEIAYNKDINCIIDVYNKNEDEIEKIDINLENKIKKPTMTNYYASIPNNEKSHFINKEILFKSLYECEVIKLTEVDIHLINQSISNNLENTENIYKLNLKENMDILSIFFYSKKNNIKNITCFTIINNNIINLFDNIDYYKSENITDLCFSHKTIDKNKFICISFCNYINSLDPEGCINSNDYYFRINFNSEYEKINSVILSYNNYII